MKVKDLIEKLEKFPENHEVIIVSKKKWEKKLSKVDWHYIRYKNPKEIVVWTKLNKELQCPRLLNVGQSCVCVK